MITHTGEPNAAAAISMNGAQLFLADELLYDCAVVISNI